jgi:sugar phosphate isomerase/epimerase
MKLAISNLAWEKKDNHKLIKYLKTQNISFLEYSPYKLFLFHKTFQEIIKFYKKKKIKLYSMQSVFFNEKNYFIFGNNFERELFFNKLKNKINLASRLGTKIIVFGSPITRKVFNLTKSQQYRIAYNLFKKIATLCKKKKIIFCFEANPKIYGCEFINTTKEAFKFVKIINNEYFKINLDLGTIIYNKENYNEFIRKNVKYIGHVQLSVPGLSSLKKYYYKIYKFLKTLKILKYSEVISIEMLNLNFNLIKKDIIFVKKLLK